MYPILSLVLIFNTSEKAHSPIYVIPASSFGRPANTDIPVCLAYDQVHYEGLVPCTEEDVQKTISLANKYLHGEYNLSMMNMPKFQNMESTDIEFTKKNKKIISISKDEGLQEIVDITKNKKQTNKLKSEI